jgi:signal transduction histidine kinase
MRVAKLSAKVARFHEESAHSPFFIEISRDIIALIEDSSVIFYERRANMLKFIRLVMLVFIPIVYMQHATLISHKIFIVMAMLAFVVTHTMMMKIGQRVFYACIIVDFILIGAFGFVFAPSTLYLILFGVEGVTLFLMTGNRMILSVFSLLFFAIWGSIVGYTYMRFEVIEIMGNLLNFTLILFQVLVGGLIRKLEQARMQVNRQYDELHESHAQLSVYAKEVESLTVIRERNKIARDIHDTVGHNMTALLVQLQLAEELVKQGRPEAHETLHICSHLARSSLQEIRLSVRTLKEDGEKDNLIVGIRTILEDFAKSADVEVAFQLQGDPMIIPMSLHPTIARTIQESLTNAKRHGDATLCHVELTCEEDRICLVISDNGKGAHVFKPGFGLINMKGRIEEHGGSVQFKSKEGFHVQVEFPLLQKKWVIGGSL